MKYTKHDFKDVQFMSKEDKFLVARQFDTFLKHGMKFEHFTDRLYKHFSLHCGFIAHYNRHGFYNTYFNGDMLDYRSFFSHFEKPWCYTNEYDDINKALSEIYLEHKAKIFQVAENDTQIKYQHLKELVEYAQTNVDLRNRLVRKFTA